MPTKVKKTLIKRNPRVTPDAEPEQERTLAELCDDLRDLTSQRRLHSGLASHEIEELRMDLGNLIEQVTEFVPEEGEEEDAGEV